MARDFYRCLFEADPTVEALFDTDPEVMAGKFSDELAAIMLAIVDFDTFVPRVRDLAARHVAYGVKTRHYRLVGDALIGALAAQLGPDWNPELEAAWRRAYNLVAEVMLSST